MKRGLIVLTFVLLALSALAVQINIVGEVFTESW
jgi:hypothetical protein